jgi:hypothetical protein
MKHTISPKNQRTVTLEMSEDDFFLLFSALDYAKTFRHHSTKTNEVFANMQEQLRPIYDELRK